MGNFLCLAIALLALTNHFTGPVLAHGLYRRGRSLHRRSNTQLQQRQVSGPSQVTYAQLQQLQLYFETYHKWITDYINQRDAAAPSTVQLQQRFQAFEGWVDAWLKPAMGSGLTPPIQQAGGQLTSTTNAISTAAASPDDETPAGSKVTQKTVSVDVIAVPTNPSVVDNGPSAPIFVSGGVVTSNSSNEKASTGVFRGSESPVSVFNSRGTNSVVVYWGQAAELQQVGLMALCNDANVNIINLAFLLGYKGPGGYPIINFSSGCGGNSPEQLQKGATGLLYCPEMTKAIETCQKNGKKVLLSIGGAAAAQIDLASRKDATDAATMLWDLFGGGTGQPERLRPFGKVKLDGFDIDDENNRPQYYTDFVKALRNRLSTDKQKSYYLSAAPQCPFPDASIPLEAMQIMDYVWVQFYNNPPCNLDTKNFADSFRQWSESLFQHGTGPRVYIGAPGCPVPKCSNNAYVDKEGLKRAVSQVKGLKNFGGVMLWEGSKAKLNNDYIKTVKEVLSS